MSDSVDERIKFLSAEIIRHSELYYNHSAPEISDSEFDSLWEELKKLDADNEVLHRVGPEPLPGTEKVEHMFPMLSLDKGTTDDDIIHFVTQSTSGGKRYLAQPKLDGSCAVIFTNGTETVVKSRHRRCFTRFKMDMREIQNIHRGDPRTWMVVVGEYMNKSRRDERGCVWNQKLVIFDILVYESKLLLGMTKIMKL